MVAYRLKKDEARRIAIQAQMLHAQRPPDLVDVVDRLTVLQIDPTAAIAPSADLVLWSRLGSKYDPADLTRAIEHDRTLVETVAYVRSPTGRHALTRAIDGEPALAQPWLRTLVTDLNAR